MTDSALQMSANDPNRTSQTILVSASFSFLKAVRLVPHAAHACSSSSTGHVVNVRFRG